MSSKAAAKKRNEKLVANSANYGSVYLNVNDPSQHWDYAIAFPNPETRTTPAPVSMQEILEKLHEHGLQFKLFYSSTRDMVLCQIRCHYKRLQMEADRIDMPVLLDAKALQATAERGFPELGIAPFAISDVKRLYDFHPYEHIHAAYEDDDEQQNLFAKRNLDGSVFAPVERMKLIESIIVSHECCNLDLDALCVDGSILACFPLHNEDEIAHLAKAWIPKIAAPWTQPIEEIRDYFGERIAFYFGYLGHYTTWLMYASIVALIVFFIDVATKTEERTIEDANGLSFKSEVPSVMTFVIPAFAIFMCIWSTLFMESWKRKQQVYAMKWGMTEIEGEESTRPQFTGEPVLSAITGAKTRYFPSTKKYQRVAVSWALLFLLCSVVIAIVAGIFRLRYKLVEGQNAWKADFMGLKIPVGIAVCSGANVIQIIIMGKIYYRSFYRLNEYENHETDAQYENSLVLKTFVFQFINNFSALIYIAFLKNIFEEPSNSRLHELAYSLAIVYGSQLVIGNVKEILLPRVWVWLSKRSILKQEVVAEHQSEAEKEFFLATYEWSGTFDDFTEIITQFGFCTLFVVAFPLTPVLSLLNNYLEIRVDGYRLLFENRRPRPRNASNIGLWMEIIEFMTTLAIVTNAYVVVWTSNTLDFLEAKYSGHPNMIQLTRVEAFMIFVAVMLAFRFCIAKLISDVPPSVVAQIKRQLFFNNKAIYRLPDDIVSKYSRRPDDVFDMTIQESG